MGETHELPPAVTFRAMGLADLDAVVAVERSAFLTPWSRDAFVSEVADNDLACYLVAEQGREVIGYAGCWIIFDEAHVTNVAVLPAWRGRGVGAGLMAALIAVAKKLGARRMTLEVRPANLAARRLYDRLGFAAYGLRPGYYADTGEDALIMWRDGL